MKTPEYLALEAEILSLLKTPTFTAHKKTWDQSQNIWQFYIASHLKTFSDWRDSWNLRSCYRWLVGALVAQRLIL